MCERCGPGGQRPDYGAPPDEGERPDYGKAAGSGAGLGDFGLPPPTGDNDTASLWPF